MSASTNIPTIAELKAAVKKAEAAAATAKYLADYAKADYAKAAKAKAACAKALTLAAADYDKALAESKQEGGVNEMSTVDDLRQDNRELQRQLTSERMTNEQLCQERTRFKELISTLNAKLKESEAVK